MTAALVLCVPFAGAGASFFHPWKKLAEDTLEILPVQLPGREERIMEDLARDVTSLAHALAEQVVEQVVDRVAGRSGTVLFGHSLGGVIAYELAHRLEETAPPGPRCLVVSGSPGPWTARADRATGLPDDLFLECVREFAGGYSHPALEDPDMREYLLPILRADVEMHESYRPPSRRRLTMPIISVRGVDDALVNADQASDWQDATDGPFDLVELPGGHMYLVESPEPLLQTLRKAASR